METTVINTNCIRSWAEDDRPREKLIQKGQKALSDSELIAILIGSGYKEKSAVALAKEILSSVGNNLFELSKLTTADLMTFKGIGEAKAVSIAAAVELGNRRRSADALQRQSFTCSKDVSDYFSAHLSDKKQEEFHTIILNKSNKVVKHLTVSKGSVDGTVVDIKYIIKEAISVLASSLILCHNHPSGNTKPSMQDKELTNKIKGAAEFFDIRVLDHIIIAEDTYFSFADEGLI